MQHDVCELEPRRHLVEAHALLKTVHLLCEDGAATKSSLTADRSGECGEEENMDRGFDRELLFEVAARIVATPQNVTVSSDSAIEAAKQIIKRVESNPDRSPFALASIARAAGSVFAARTPNNNSPANIDAAIDAVTNLLPKL